MSDFILARVANLAAGTVPWKPRCARLLEMLEAVTRMESAPPPAGIDTNAQRQQIAFAHNSSGKRSRKDFPSPRCESLCKRALEDQCVRLAMTLPTAGTSCIAARELGIATFLSIPVRLADLALRSAPSAPPAGNNSPE